MTIPTLEEYLKNPPIITTNVDEYKRLHPEEFNDSVDHPQHYTNGEIECKDAIKSALTPEEYRGWIKGNAIKYIWRERYKGGTEDLAKARNFLSWLDSGGGQNE